MPIERTASRTGRAKRIDPDESLRGDVDPERNAEPPWEDEASSNGEEKVDIRPQSRRGSRRETKPQPKPQPAARRSRAQQRGEDDGYETGNEEARGKDTVLPRIRHGREEINKARREKASGIFFRWTDDGSEQIVKFLDIEPWSFSQHWVTRTGKQSFACIGDGCPMCRASIKATDKIVYQVLNLSLEEPMVQGLEVGVSIYEDLEAENEDKRNGPLPKLWWGVSRTKLARPKGLQKWNPKFSPLDERDLEEEYQIDIEWAEDALAAAEPLTEEQYFGRLDPEFLAEIVEEQYRS